MLKKSIKAALLSALVIPGAGHLVVKKYFAGMLLMSFSAVALYIIISKSIQRAQLIVDEIVRGSIQPDAATITQMIQAQSAGGESGSLSIATTIFVIIWCIGIIDSYRQGRKLDAHHEVNKH